MDPRTRTASTETDIVPYTGQTPYGQVVYVQDEGALDLAWQMAVTAYLESKRARSGSDRTPRIYGYAIERFLAWTGGMPLRDVTSAVAQHYAAWMRSDRSAPDLQTYLDQLDGEDLLIVAGDPPGPLSPATINLHVAGISGLYNFVRDRYQFRRPDGDVLTLWPADRANPFAAVDRAQVRAYKRSKYPSTDELLAILALPNVETLTGRRDFALLYTLATSCRRVSDILNLRWGDIVERNEDGDYVFQYHYKGDQRNELRKAVLQKLAYQAICAYLVADNRPPETMQPGDYIFIPLSTDHIKRLPNVDPTKVDGTLPISQSYANRILKKYARRVIVDGRQMDITRAHVHGLRHAGARLRVQQMRERSGVVDYEKIMELLGHSSLAVTQIYIQTVCTDPRDPGGQDAASALLPKSGRRKRSRPAPPAQETYLEDK